MPKKAHVQTTINAKPGETLHVVLKSTGTVPKIAMAHNFVLLKLGTDIDAFLKSAMNARETRCPVIVLTAETAPLVRAQALDLGADAFLTKPAPIDELEQLLSRIVVERS